MKNGIIFICVFIFLLFSFIYVIQNNFKYGKESNTNSAVNEDIETKKQNSTTITKKNTSEVDLLKNMKASDITFDKDKINIYLFWGSGCPHCKELALFLKSLDQKYKDCYNLYTFEIWYNPDNEKLMNQFSDFINKKISGVPFLIIGEEIFTGYKTNNNEKIKEAIETQYNREVHYDIYKEIISNS